MYNGTEVVVGIMKEAEADPLLTLAIKSIGLYSKWVEVRFNHQPDAKETPVQLTLF